MIQVKTSTVAGLIGIVMCSGCRLWAPGYDLPLPTSASEPVVSADRAFDRADSNAKVEQARARYIAALDSAMPDRRHVLNRLAEIEILLGAAYRDRPAQKRARFRAGIRYAERSLVENVPFRDALDRDEAFGDAVMHLQSPDLKAMLLFVTGVSYLFDEGLGPLRRMLHFRSLRLTQDMLDRMDEIEPAFEYGSVPFSRAIYHIAVPEIAGGDIELARALFAEAMRVSEGSMLIPWGRGKYYHEYVDDQRSLRADLEWVLDRDPAAAPSPYAWNVYFQTDARRILAEKEAR